MLTYNHKEKQAGPEMGQAQVQLEFGWEINSLRWSRNQKFQVVAGNNVEIDV